MLASLPEAIDAKSLNAWVEFVLKLQTTGEDARLILNFTEALMAQDVGDTVADAIAVEGNLYHSQWQDLRTRFEALSLNQSDQQWQLLLSDPRLEGIGFYLNELRKVARSKMPVELESLALELSVNGYHAWDQLYNKMAGELRADFEQDGKVSSLSMGQLATKMASPDRSIRQQAFEKMTQAWRTREDLAAMMLNSLGGFRLSLYGRRNWDSVIREPLVMCRMEEKTLDTMWKVVALETKRFQPYIDAKKKLLGIDKFRWYDEFAPCGSADRLYNFDEAGQFIIDNARTFSSDMADFFKMALEKRWVEAEDRPGKRAGAFCTRMGAFRETRVFMTYAGSYENLLTLAHELGHAYHGWVLKDKPHFAGIYPMNLAETASIFIETLVNDAALERTSDPQEKLMLLDQKLQRAYGMFTNLHCRYIFDRAFYDERANGAVSKDRLNELMVKAQKQAFGSLLDESGYHPLFWCSKLHFFISEIPLYNFPYTFGFLFAGGVYDRARKEGAEFADRYTALLAEAGSMTTEELAHKYLDVDLTQEDFWADAVNRALADVDEFVKMVNPSS
ncbi:MAG: M3 family oligoendopeptidase [Candidatus Zixiibacteriota bacterium]|nr:MAG: M3 family oligoendopeptidase [candidate division Zixibacteria bacterium]